MRFSAYVPPSASFSPQYREKRDMLREIATRMNGIRVVDQLEPFAGDITGTDGSSYLLRTAAGAAIGGFFGGKKGALAGGAIGLLAGKTLVGFGDTTPQMTTDDIVLAQRSLKSLGFDVDVNGKYDAKTSAAVLEFRGASGLPRLNQIDDDFSSRLYDEVDAVGNDRLNPDAGGSGGIVPDINITGKVGAVGFGLLFLAGLYLWNKNRGK